MSTLMLVGNPAKKRRSAKQRANDKKLGQMARARAASKKRRTRKAAPAAVAPAAVAPRRRRAVATIRRRVRRYASRANAGYRLGGVVPMVKNAGVGAIGAIGVDVAYGFAQPYLPAMVQTPINADGGINFAYYVAKGGAAIGIGMLGKRLLGRYAPAVVMGSLIVTMHELTKLFLASSGVSVPMGAGYNPARTLPPLPAAQNLRQYLPRGTSPQMQPRGVGMGAYISAGRREMLAR